VPSTSTVRCTRARGEYTTWPPVRTSTPRVWVPPGTSTAAVEAVTVSRSTPSTLTDSTSLPPGTAAGSPLGYQAHRRRATGLVSVGPDGTARSSWYPGDRGGPGKAAPRARAATTPSAAKAAAQRRTLGRRTAMATPAATATSARCSPSAHPAVPPPRTWAGGRATPGGMAGGRIPAGSLGPGRAPLAGAPGDGSP